MTGKVPFLLLGDGPAEPTGLARIARDLAAQIIDDPAENEMEARKTATAALNRLNQAQKAFDTAVNSIRQSAPRASNWLQKRGVGALDHLAHT